MPPAMTPAVGDMLTGACHRGWSRSTVRPFASDTMIRFIKTRNFFLLFDIKALQALDEKQGGIQADMFKYLNKLVSMTVLNSPVTAQDMTAFPRLLAQVRWLVNLVLPQFACAVSASHRKLKMNGALKTCTVSTDWSRK